MMALDMTVQLAPVVWGMFGLLAVSAAGIIASAVAHGGSLPKPIGRPARRLRPLSLPASA